MTAPVDFVPAWGIVALMLAAIIDFALWIAGLFGFGKPDPVAQGEKLGRAEQGQADFKGELNDIAKADRARNSVSDAPADVVRDKANLGPAGPG